MSLGSISHQAKSNTERRVKISAVISKEGTLIRCLLSNSKHFTPIFESTVNVQIFFFGNCTHLLTRTQEKKFENVFLLNTART